MVIKCVDRREALAAAGGYAPKLRERFVSPTPRAYAATATSADTGAVRDVDAVERAMAAARATQPISSYGCTLSVSKYGRRHAEFG